jgi:hypothetical protein
MTKSKNKFKDLPDSDYQLMLSSKKIVFHGKRLWRFYEAQFYFSLIFLAPVIGTLLRINKVGLENNILLLFVIVPLFLIFFLISYRRSELNFIEVVNNNTQEQNCILIKKAIQDLKWRIENESVRHLEVFTSNGPGLTWGDEMVTVIIADNSILINCQCNLDYYKTQGMFTFGKLTRTAKKLKNKIELESENAGNTGITER